MAQEEFRIDELSNYRRDTGFLRWFVLVLTVIFVLVLAGVVFYYDSRLKEKEQNVWVIDSYQRPYQARQVSSLSHADRFIEYERMIRELFATYFSADEDSWKQNLDLGLELLSQEAGQELQLRYFEQEKIEKNVTELGWVYEARIDSVLWEPDRSYPFKGYAIGKQVVKMPQRTLVRNLYLRFTLYNTQKRTHRNSWAAKLDGVEIINNKVLGVEER